MALKDFFRIYVYPVATLAGGVIGVGFLSLPYIATKTGVWLMLLYFVILTALIIFLQVIFGSISLRTPDFKRWPGFVGFYLGAIPRKIILVSMTLGSFGVLLVYLIIGSEFLTQVMAPVLGGNQLLYSVWYFALVSTFIFFGVKAISRVDVLAIVLLLSGLFAIFIKAYPKLRLADIFLLHGGIPAGAGAAEFFLPYGAIMFSLWGVGLIPEVEEMVRSHKRALKTVIIASTLLAAVFYLLFMFLILGITGANTTESALVGVKQFFGNGVTTMALMIGVITTFIACIAQGLLLKKVFMYDMGVKEFPAWVFACFVPFILFLLGVNSFIPLISFIGGVLLSIDGILILMMYKKIGGKRGIIYPLSLIFVAAALYEIIYFTMF